MTKRVFANARLACISMGFLTFLSVGFAESAATAQSRGSKHREDARTCASFGSRPGSSAYSNCMLEQQRRRDTKELDKLEKMQRTSQIAKDGQIMAERARLQRCERNPNRRECGR
jgi:hypothetical protein